MVKTNPYENHTGRGQHRVNQPLAHSCEVSSHIWAMIPLTNGNIRPVGHRQACLRGTNFSRRSTSSTGATTEALGQATASQARPLMPDMAHRRHSEYGAFLVPFLRGPKHWQHFWQSAAKAHTNLDQWKVWMELFINFRLHVGAQPRNTHTRLRATKLWNKVLVG